MAAVKISELPAGSSVGATDQFATNQSGTTRRVTALQIKTYALGNAYASFAGPTAARTFTLPDADASLAILGANTFTGDQNLQDNDLVRALLKDCATVYYDAGNVAGLDYTNGSEQRWAPTGTKTLTITGWPPSGNTGVLLIRGINLAAATLTWPTINWLKKDGSYTTTLSTYLTDAGTSLQASGTDLVYIWTWDGGTTLYGKVVR